MTNIVELTDLAELAELTHQHYEIEITNAGEFRFCAHSATSTHIINEIKERYQETNGFVSLGITICVDTLILDQNENVFNAGGLTIIARHIQADGFDGNSDVILNLNNTLNDPFPYVIEIVTQEITGKTLYLQTHGAPIAIAEDSRSNNQAPFLIRMIAMDESNSSIEYKTKAEEFKLSSFLQLKQSINALKASFQGVTRLLYGDKDERITAKNTAVWVDKCCSELIKNQVVKNRRHADIVNLKAQNAALMMILAQQDGESQYVPILIGDFYDDQIKGLLSVAETYHNLLSDLENRGKLETIMEQFAGTLKQISTSSKTPLEKALNRLQQQAAGHRRQYNNAVQKFKIQSEEVKKIQKKYESGMKQHEIWGYINWVMEVINMTAEISIAVASAGSTFAGGKTKGVSGQMKNEVFVNGAWQSVPPPWTNGPRMKFRQVFNANITNTSSTFNKLIGRTKSFFELIKLAMKIGKYVDQIHKEPRKPGSPIDFGPISEKNEKIFSVSKDCKADFEAGKVSASLKSEFTKAKITLTEDEEQLRVTKNSKPPIENKEEENPTIAWWMIEDIEHEQFYVLFERQGIKELEVYNGDALHTLYLNKIENFQIDDEEVPIDVQSINGLNPATYWNEFTISAEAAIQAAVDKGIGGASEYLTSLRLLSEYGKSLANSQSELMRLHGEALDTIARINAVATAEQKWEDLQKEIHNNTEAAKVFKSLVLEGYNNVKRSLFVAVANYKAAYFYKWLVEPPLRVDLGMGYQELKHECSRVKDGLEKLLNSTKDGIVRPLLQDFDPISIEIPLSDKSEFEGAKAVQFDKNGKLTWDFSIQEELKTNALTNPYTIQIYNNFTGEPPAIYIKEATFYLEGAKPDDSQKIKMNVSTSGKYAHRLGNSHFDFVSPKYGMDCVYDEQNGTLNYTTTWRPSKEIDVYMRPSPFSEWTLEMKNGWENITAVTMKFSGYYLHEHK